MELLKSFKKRFLLFLGCITLLTILLPTDRAVAVEGRFYKIEAAFLYNFFNYITWPHMDSPEQLKTPVICVYGSNSLYSSLEYVRQKKVAERNLKLRWIDDPTNSSSCNILFVGENGKRGQSSYHNLNRPGLLVISDIPGFIDRGGMIELTQDGGRIVMSIDNTALNKAGFQVSSRLLSIARRVD